MKMFDAGKTRVIGLPYGEKNCDDMLTRFHLIPKRTVLTQKCGKTMLLALLLQALATCQRRRHVK